MVHRSADQIGGNCVELAIGDHRLFLDAGSPLDAGDAAPAALVPATLDTTRPVDGVVVSHPHQDHYGVLAGLPPRWPVWAGGPSEVLMRLTASLTGRSIPQRIHRYHSFHAFSVGPFEVTPLLTDHSAFDAHMLLVEAAGHRVLYSGDFRRTGRKAVLVHRLVDRPPVDIDVLLLEGTTLGRTCDFPTECDLEDRFVHLFRDVPGRVFVSWSAQNIDRTVTLYRACTRAGRTLVLDVYALDVLDQLSQFSLSMPRLGWPGVRGVITGRMGWLYRNPDRVGRPELLERFARTGRCVGAAKLGDDPRAVIMLRPSLMRDYRAKGLQVSDRDAWVFSQWSGYLDADGYPEVREVFEQAGARLEHIHTSGHASRKDLLDLARSVDAKHLVPIHSFDWDEHVASFPRVRRLRDGERFEVI